MTNLAYCAIYDFNLLPYALGDVLTWNVQTAIRCEESGAKQVDIFICLDPPRHPAFIFQKNFVNAETSYLHFNELFGAFGTHPNLGNIFLFFDRDQLLERLEELSQKNIFAERALNQYKQILLESDSQDARIEYFMNYVHSHNRINHFANKNHRIPFLKPSRGCEPDVDGLISKVLAEKRIIMIHPRFRLLDVGMGGQETFARDSDYLEWYEFIRKVEVLYPEVQFVILGRLQEKPLELLRMPNVLSLRSLGLGLGHELTLMLKGD